jgi:hypothetical protein
MSWLQTYVSGTLQNWANRLELSIDHTKIDESLSNFPVAIDISSSAGQNNVDVSNLLEYLRDESNTNLYQKIALTDSSGDSEMYVEVDYWDYANKSARIWTKVPYISSTSDTTLYLYYDSRVEDNSTYVGDIGSAAGRAVWDENFLAVYHMGNDPGSENLVSSCDANSDFVGTFNSMASANLVDTPYGKALSFDGATDWIDISWQKRLGVQTLEVTIEAFVKGTGSLVASDRTAAGMGNAGFSVYSDHINYQVYNMLSTSPYNSFFSLTPSGLSTDTEFSYVGFAVAGGNIDMCANYYTDSLVFNWNWQDGGPTAYNDIKLFKHQNYIYSTDYFSGQCVELRISSTGRSKSWMKATNFAIKDDLIKFPVQLYKVTGTINENMVPVERKVRLYHEATGMLVSETYSNSEGYYEITTPYTDSHYIVCLDDLSGKSYNHLIKKDVQLEAL